ncbi:MAG TPA: NACHT domain-containing protein [Pyrinomonadaceae bacterium]|nr:NACHT domain-containing protein [Pyrinomonadaceae bacterium]
MNRTRARSLVLIVVLTCLGIVSALLTQFPPDSIQKLKNVSLLGFSYGWVWTGAVVGIVILSAAAILIKERFDSTDKTTEKFPDETKDQRVRREFLTDLLDRYQERRAHKLDGRSELPLVVRDASENIKPGQFEDAGQYLIRSYERTGRLLLLGDRGSGKTMLLLGLAEHLAQKAQHNPHEPLPVILNLAAWSPAYAGFNQWVSAMLTKGYGLSANDARTLLKTRGIVFLLDGLDELARNRETETATRLRVDCLSSLAKSLSHGSMSVVICCRLEEFELLRQQPDLPTPWIAELTVEELSPAQIDRALIRVSAENTDRFAARNLNIALGTGDAGAYQQVLSNPFYFTTALQVFDEGVAPPVNAANKETLETELVQSFIEKKLQITKNDGRFGRKDTLDWLTWLAVFLDERVTFELSDLQPATLRRSRVYRLIFSFSCGVIGGAVTGLHSRVAAIGLVCGALFSLISAYIITEDLAQWTVAPLKRWRTWGISFLFGVLMAIVAVFLIMLARIRNLGPLNAFLIPDKVILLLLLVGVGAFVASVGFHLFVRVVVGLSGGARLSPIVTEDFGHWTLASLLSPRKWRTVLQSGLEGGITGSFVLCLAVLVFAAVFFTYLVFLFIKGEVLAPTLQELFMTVIAPPLAIVFAVIIGFLLGFIFAVPMGIVRVCRETSRFVSIHSAYQRLRSGIVFNIVQLVAVGWLLFTLITVNRVWKYLSGSTESTLASFLPSVALMLIFGLVGLFRTPMFKHSILRLCLSLEGRMPLRYARFLNYATELGILEREGGHWRFRHQILQAHLARRSTVAAR